MGTLEPEASTGKHNNKKSSNSDSFNIFTVNKQLFVYNLDN